MLPPRKIKRSGVVLKPDALAEKKKKELERRVRRTGSGLPLYRMYYNTPGYIHEHAKEVYIISMKKETLEDGNTRVTATLKSRRSALNPKPRKRMLVAETLNGGKLSDKKNAVKISCSCEWFCFYCEAALHKAGSADIIYSNGDKPTVTNPRMIPIICKHWITLYRKLKSKRW